VGDGRGDSVNRPYLLFRMGRRRVPHRMGAMRILVAPDKFKGVLSAREVAENIAHGLRDVLTNANIDLAPVADGGEGTAELVCDALGGTWRECAAHDAMGKAVTARYVWLPVRNTAAMEMSEVAGLRRIPPTERDIESATTFGVGEMMRHAAMSGADKIVIGLGGSATNDGGLGMARSLGFRFFDQAGTELKKPVDLLNLAHIDKSLVSRLTTKRIIAAADVRNPLLGSNGATRVFASQKAASKAQIDILERALGRLAEIVAANLGVDYRNEAGAGAAGGLGFGLMSFCGAKMYGGFDAVAEAIGLESKIKEADIVITGEGSLDRQTLEGKAPGEVALIARRHGKRVFAIVGRSDGDAQVSEMFEAIQPVADPALSDDENIGRASELLREGARRLARTLL
jgi:glycerate 2-kinase